MGQVAIHSYLQLVIGVPLKDAAGRVFDAADTVAVDWKLSDTPLAGLAAPNGVVSQPVKREDYLETALDSRGNRQIYSRHSLLLLLLLSGSLYVCNLSR